MRITKKLLKRIDKSFNMIINEYGESKWYGDIPYLHTMSKDSIMDYADDFADGKVRKKDLDLIQGWFDPTDNSIVLILENIDSIKEVVKTMLHEYQHYLQCPSWIQRYYNIGHTYDTHPYEIQAVNAERRWKHFLSK